jgi:hypothetical protein
MNNCVVCNVWCAAESTDSAQTNKLKVKPEGLAESHHLTEPQALLLAEMISNETT